MYIFRLPAPFTFPLSYIYDLNVTTFRNQFLSLSIVLLYVSYLSVSLCVCPMTGFRRSSPRSPERGGLCLQIVTANTDVYVDLAQYNTVSFSPLCKSLGVQLYLFRALFSESTGSPEEVQSSSFPRELFRTGTLGLFRARERLLVPLISRYTI